jgi:coenzyme F420 biosynthesis associated uncharacterized protein
MPAPLIDWILAEWIAARVAGRGDAPLPRVELGPIVADAQERVVAYTGLVPTGPIPPPEAISRADWVKANISSTSLMMDPMLEHASKQLKSVANATQLRLAAVGSAEVGLLVGYMAQRVMGQYELVLVRDRGPERSPRLLFVMPNLALAIKRFGADEREFLTWVALHEVTHAVQFGGVPWLQDHLGGLIEELMGRAEERMVARHGRLRLPSRERVEHVLSALRHADLLGLVASKEEQTIIDRAQAVMAVIEGHAEHVMDAVAPELLPSLPALRRALDERRKVQSPVAKLVSRLLGLEMKLRQYEQGKVFVDEIVRSGGVAAQGLLFSGPAALPTLAEIADPAAWLHRVQSASG